MEKNGKRDTDKKFICSDCKPEVNFATSGKRLYPAMECDTCGRRGICVEEKK